MSKKGKTIIILLLFLLTGSGTLNGQFIHPDPGFIYDDHSLPRIDIIIPQGDLDALYTDPWSDVEYKAQFSFTREGVKESFADIGLRIRDSYLHRFHCYSWGYRRSRNILHSSG